MLKIKRTKNEVAAQYINDFGKVENGTCAICKNVQSAKDLASKARQAAKYGYGFAAIRAIIEGDQNDYPPIN